MGVGTTVFQAQASEYIYWYLVTKVFWCLPNIRFRRRCSDIV